MNEMGGSCRAQGKLLNAHNFWLESLKGRDHTEDLDIDGGIILKCILSKSSERL
jgi:hypothetical protein